MKTSNLGDRRAYLGSTDIAAIVGVSPYMTPLDVYRAKVEGAEQTVSDVMRWGLLMEQAICDEYAQMKGYRLVRRNEVTHPQYDFIRIHPDRLIVGEDGLFDAKSTWQPGGYGEPGTDEVPPHVRVQMNVYMGILRRSWADVGVVRYRPPLGIYRVPFDPTLYLACINEAVRFQREHIDLRVPPPVDGSESYRRYLSEKHPASEAIEMVATPEQALLIDELAVAAETVRTAETHKTLVENRIREVIGDAQALIAPGGVVTWKSSKDRATVDWQSAFDEVADQYLGPESKVITTLDHTTTKPGPRVFRFTPAKAHEEAA